MSQLFPYHNTLESGQQVTIRVAVPSDAARVLDCLNQVGGETDYLTFGADNFQATVEEERNFIKWCHQRANSLMLVVELDSEIVGVLTFMGNNQARLRHTGELGLSLLRRYWGQGIGSMLLSLAIAWAKETGIIRKIKLRVHEDNYRAVRLYERFGFQREGIISREYLVQDKFYNNLLMGLLID